MYNMALRKKIKIQGGVTKHKHEKLSEIIMLFI